MASFKFRTGPESDEAKFARRLGELRQQVHLFRPMDLASRSGAAFHPHSAESGEFRFALWGRGARLTFPDLVVQYAGDSDPAPPFLQALLLYYFASSDGAKPSGEFISFSELPEGRFYNQAFQGYTGKELSRRFGLDVERFRRVAQAAGGHSYPLGDAAFLFQALPRLALLVVYWQGDEDFPSSCQILFESTASHYMPTDGCAILGSLLTRKLLSAEENDPRD